MQKVLHSVARGTIRVASGTMLSRISGLLRDVTTAALFGASKELALFFVAFRFSNLLRRLLAETPLAASVVPAATHHPDRQKLFLQLTGCASLVGLALTLFYYGIYWIIHPLSNPDWQEILTLTGIMFPSIIFLVGTGVNTAFLQVAGRMFPIGASSALCNLVWIALLPVAAHSSCASTVLAWAVLGGFAVQYFWTVFAVYRAHQFVVLRNETSLFTEVRPLVAPFLLSMTGIAASQINNALDPIFAQFAAAQAPAYLWYAVRLYLLPLSLFGVAFFTALFPSLAQIHDTSDTAPFWKLVHRGTTYTIWFFVVLSCAVLLTAEDLVVLLYYRGAFTLEDMAATSQCLRAYIIGLPPYALVLLWSQVYYARGKYRWPAIASVLAVITNIVLNGIFVFTFGFGAASVALATSCAAYLNCVLLIKRWVYPRMWTPLLAGGAGFFLSSNIPFPTSYTTLASLLHGGAVAVVFLGIATLLFVGTKKAKSI